MFKIYITRVEDPDYIYRRETYQQARCLANSQQKEYVDEVEIIDVETNETVYHKKVNTDRTGWNILVKDK